MPATGLYVSPTGNDNNAGTLAAPLATLQRARNLADAGQTIWLLEGVYNTSNQLSWGSLSFPNPVYVRGFDAGVVLEGLSTTGLGIGLAFLNGGGLSDVTVRMFATGVFANAGTFDVRRVTVDNTALPFNFRGTVSATVDTTVVTGTPATAFAGLAVVEETASLTWRGGQFMNVGVATPAFFVRGQATFTAEDVVIANIRGAGLNVWDNARATLRRVQIADAGQVGQPGAASAAIYVGAQNTGTPLTTSITLESSSVTASRGAGIGFVQYNRATQQRITLLDSHLDGNARAGVEVIAPTLPPDGGLQLTATDTSFDNNGLDGVLMDRGFVELSGGSLQNNGAHGLRLVVAADNRLVARGTRITGNRGHGVWFNGDGAAQLDLGTASDAGRLTFGVPDAGSSNVRLQAPIQGSAVGNVWAANEQGADGTGRYVAATTFGTGSSGRNVTVLDGGSLVVQ